MVQRQLDMTTPALDTPTIRARPRPRVVRLLIGACLAIGVVLRAWQFLANVSLWKDELPVGTAIIDIDLVALLTQPLPNDQVAPKGFLLIEKLAVMTLGSGDLVLRLFPFACGVLALFAFAAIALKVLKDVGAVAATAMFATAVPLIHFGAQSKQYSVDVCVAIVLWLLATVLCAAPVTSKRAWGLGLTGAVLAWLSQTAVFVLAGIGIVFAWWALSNRNLRRPVAVVVALWSVSAFAVTAAGFASMTPETVEYMHRYWALGFAPDRLSTELSTFWPLDRLLGLISDGVRTQGTVQASFGYPVAEVYALLASAGSVLLWLRNRSIALLLLAPIAVALGAALARQYPFADRQILFLTPAIVLGIASSIQALSLYVSSRTRLGGYVAAAVLLLPTLSPVVRVLPPYQSENMKPVLSFVQAHLKAGDAVYVFYRGAAAYTYYADQYDLRSAEHVIGGCYADVRDYMRELDRFRGRTRVWVVESAVGTRRIGLQEVLAYLRRIGTQVDEYRVAPHTIGRVRDDAGVFLFELSGTAVSAEDLALEASVRIDAICDGPNTARRR